jgi:predicted ATP-binding protein involved in virulence
MTPFRISKLEINNIGAFGNLVLDFPEKPASMRDKAEIHILTGENGTGKSTILEILVGSLSKGGYLSNSKNRYSDEQSNHITTFKIDWRDIMSKWYHANNHFNGSNYWHNIKNIREYWEEIDKGLYDGKFSTAFFAYSGYRRVGQVDINAIQELQSHPFNDVLNFQNSINPQIILQWIANVISKEALAKSQNDISIAQQYRSTISLLELAISKIIEQPIRFYLGYEPLNVTIEIDGKRLDFNQLPDGLKSIVSWLSDLLMRMDRIKWVNDTPVFERNFLLFLDEIEVHLHPAWQRKILPAVQSLFPNAQIFISTHSPFVVGSVDGAWIHKLVKPNGDTKLAEKPILSEDSRSVWYWLREIFDINEEFGQEAQQDLDKFYLLRDALLVNGTPTQRNEFKTVANALVNQNSKELETIVAFELRQLNKKLTEPISL